MIESVELGAESSSSVEGEPSMFFPPRPKLFLNCLCAIIGPQIMGGSDGEQGVLSGDFRGGRRSRPREFL
jgi:hypothetical protein